MNNIFSADSANVIQLQSKEKELFGGLDQVGKGTGRIYKRLESNGEYTFFRAAGFWSGLYHFLFSKRISQEDVERLDYKVVKWIATGSDNSSKLRVEATFDRVLRQLKENSAVDINVYRISQIFTGYTAHDQLIHHIIKKINALVAKPAVQKDDLITLEDLIALHEFDNTTSAYNNWSFNIYKVSSALKGNHPIRNALKAFSQLDDQVAKEIQPVDINALKAMKISQYSDKDIAAILEAKTQLTKLNQQHGGYVNIESFRSAHKGLDRLFEVANLIDDKQVFQVVSNKKLIENLVLENGQLYFSLPENLKADFGIASAVLMQNPNDKNLVKEVVQRFGVLLVLAGDKAKDDEEVVKSAVKNNPRAFEHASKRIQTTDLEVAKIALAHSTLQPDLKKTILKQNPQAFQFLSEGKEKFEFASLLLNDNPNNTELAKIVLSQFGQLLYLAGEKLKDDAEVVKLAIKTNPEAFVYASKRIQTTDQNIAKLALTHSEVKPALIKIILEQNTLAYDYLSDKDKSNPEYAALVVGKNLLASLHLSEDKRNAVLSEKWQALATGKEKIDEYSLAELGFLADFALKNPHTLKDAKQKTSLWVMGEKIAQAYLKVGNFDKCLAWRMKLAQALAPEPPLADMEVRLQNEHPKLGLKLTSVDTSLFKHQTFSVQRQTFTDGKRRLRVNAKLSHHARGQLEKTLTQVISNPDQLLKGLPADFCKKVSVSEDYIEFNGRVDKGATKFEGEFSSDISKEGFRLSYKQKVINFEGIGKVKIGSSSYCRSEYNRLEIELEPGVSESEAASKLSIMFAALGLGPVNSSSRDIDVERIKVMQLFRVFYPQQAFAIERNGENYDKTLQELKELIIAAVPDMKQKFKHYFEDHPELIYEQEVYPGQSIWAIRGLSDEVRKAGGMGLMAGVTGSSFDIAANRLASMLKIGPLSTQDRFQLGIIAAGVSSEDDLRTGGAESVFTRLLTNNMPKNPNSYPLPGQMQVLYDLDLIERGGFAYTGDKYGTKEEGFYKYRSSIVELAKKYSNDVYGNTYLGNEVCIRNRIPPRFVKGVMVSSQSQKEDLLKVLRAEGLVTQAPDKTEQINGMPIDKFIHIGNLQADYWA